VAEEYSVLFILVDYPQKEQQIADAEKSIAQIDAILNDLDPTQSHFKPSLESCRNALIALTPLLAEWPSVI